METLDGGTAGHLILCTASETQTCQIVSKLATLNKMLWGSGFELQEQPKTFNQIRIRSSPFTSPTVEHTGTCKQEHAELLHWLLATHKCIGSISLDLSLANDTSMRLLRTISPNNWVKTVKISDIEASAASTISAALPCLTKIETLHLACFKCLLDGFIDPLCTLLQTSSSLKCLHLSGYLAQEMTINMLFTTFLRKPALEDLRIQGLPINSDTRPQALKEYLSLTTALKTLSVTVMNLFMQRALLEGVLKNRSIEKLSLFGFLEDEESATLVSRIIRENPIIRMLHIWTTREREQQPVLNSIYDCWVTPLIDNSALEELGLPFSMLHPTMWSVLFRALSTKESFKMVDIDMLSGYSNLQWLCSELKGSGCEGKVSLGHHNCVGRVDLLDCKAFSGAYFPLSHTDTHKIAILRRLPSHEHIKYISIWIQNDHTSLSLALAEYLRSSTTLEVLELGVIGAAVAETGGVQQWWNIILESLSRNMSIKKMEVRMFGMSNRDTEEFADSLKRNTYIRRLRLANIAAANTTSFFRRLSEGIEDNYTLMRVNFDARLESDAAVHWLAVREATLRNFGVVARAARMKEASPLDRYVTAAVERVVRHPTLLDEVAKWAQLDQTELAVLARDRLRRTQSLDGFMQIAGVVKDRVVCHLVDDGRLQVDGLNEDCWRHVRQYLSTDDVKCAAQHLDKV